MSGFQLPVAPQHLTGKVKAWSEPVIIPTYEPAAPDKNPMFLEKRVYQGSSGKVYPLPFIDRISEERVDRSWQALHIENEFLRVMILPEIGGRIHLALDKTNGYDFIYRQNVIKPALVGLAGPWISGGIEFNWPQHHRPGTFMPVDFAIENHEDGSATVWCSEHEPMNRTKGMHGVCLHPDRAVIELKVRLYNRTELVQTFLWWANVAARVHEKYQSFFPWDVSHVADHAKRAMSRFPSCEGKYYGVDYGKRAGSGVPSDETPRQFSPIPELCASNDLGWYANIPVPTSYMAMGSAQDYFGGYDHERQAGFIHVANHHIAPGKKQWTWGNHEFGYSWGRHLTDDDGPYIELMAGVYTDNQPDFSFIHPGETRTWSQFWYPIQKIGPAVTANVDAAISLRVQDHFAIVGVAVNRIYNNVKVILQREGKTLTEFSRQLRPGHPLVERAVIGDAKESELAVRVFGAGSEIIHFTPEAPARSDVPEPAREPEMPQDVQAIEQLYLIGVHLDQYRHATRQAADYWREALKREPGDARCNNAMGSWHYRRGEFKAAEAFFRAAIRTLTRYNPNPADNEPFYNLGLALTRQGRFEEAYAAFYKATWNYSWQSPAFYSLAQIDCRASRWGEALEHLDRCLAVNLRHSQARSLKALVLRELGRNAEADELLERTLAADRLDWWAAHLSGRELRCSTQLKLDIAWDYFKAGFADNAVLFLQSIDAGKMEQGTAPLIGYSLGYFLESVGNEADARRARLSARSADPDYCFPSRLDEIAIVQSAIAADPQDARAPYYLGNHFYDRGRHREAIELWELSTRLDRAYSVAWRNLGIGYFNVDRNPNAARAAYENAFAANPNDARLLYERDQLWKRLAESPEQRLTELLKHPALIQLRDDLSIEVCSLYNQLGRPAQALSLLQSRQFQPWEGGEGAALGQYVRCQLLLGREALRSGETKAACAHFRCALDTPLNLGERRHLLANQSDVHYWLGMALDAAGERDAARGHFLAAAEARGDFQEMAVRDFSEMTLFSALALRALGRAAQAESLLKDLHSYATGLFQQPARIDYFATSLPTMLLFTDDPQVRQTRLAHFLDAQAKWGLGDAAGAETLVKQILAQDPGNAVAADLAEMMKVSAASAGPRDLSKLNSRP